MLACAGWNETFRRNDAEISNCQAVSLFEGIHVQYSDTMRFTVLYNRHHKVPQSGSSSCIAKPLLFY